MKIPLKKNLINILKYTLLHIAMMMWAGLKQQMNIIMDTEMTNNQQEFNIQQKEQ